MINVVEVFDNQFSRKWIFLNSTLIQACLIYDCCFSYGFDPGLYVSKSKTCGLLDYIIMIVENSAILGFYC